MNYDVFAIRYAHIFLPRSACFHGTGDSAEQRLDFYFWVVAGNSRIILVDTGFNAQVAAARGRTATLAPLSALSKLSIAPEAVDTVIMTHLHYDHAGNSDMFPNARFHLQVAEMAFATGPAMIDPAHSQYYSTDDLGRFVRLVHEGRVQFGEGDGEIAPGIEGFLVPGHTDGLQVVRVAGSRGPVVLASDALHFYASMREDRPFPVATDLEAKRRGYRRLLQLAGDDERIVAGHDPEVMRFFPHRRGHEDIAQVDGDPVAPLATARPHLGRDAGTDEPDWV